MRTRPFSEWLIGYLVLTFMLDPYCQLLIVFLGDFFMSTKEGDFFSKRHYIVKIKIEIAALMLLLSIYVFNNEFKRIMIVKSAIIHDFSESLHKLLQEHAHFHHLCMKQ